MNNSNKNFYCCSLCGKKLIERKSNGIWRFVFGRERSDDSTSNPVVSMEILGHVKMQCMRRSCRRKNPDHWNTFNFLPNPIDSSKNNNSTL